VRHIKRNMLIYKNKKKIGEVLKKTVFKYTYKNIKLISKIFFF